MGDFGREPFEFDRCVFERQIFDGFWSDFSDWS